MGVERLAGAGDRVRVPLHAPSLGIGPQDEPLVDVAEAGDRHPGTLLGHYQKPDPETTLRVILGGMRRAAGR